VSGPAIGFQTAHAIIGKRLNRSSHSLGEFACESRREHADVVPTIPQRRYLDGKDIESVVQILTELSIPDGLLKCPTVWRKVASVCETSLTSCKSRSSGSLCPMISSQLSSSFISSLKYSVSTVRERILCSASSRSFTFRRISV